VCTSILDIRPKSSKLSVRGERRSSAAELLKVFIDHPRQPLSRDQIMQLAKGRELDVFDRSIDVQISRLRKILEEDHTSPKFLQTMWGFGYIFVPDGDAAH